MNGLISFTFQCILLCALFNFLLTVRLKKRTSNRPAQSVLSRANDLHALADGLRHGDAHDLDERPPVGTVIAPAPYIKLAPQAPTTAALTTGAVASQTAGQQLLQAPTTAALNTAAVAPQTTRQQLLQAPTTAAFTTAAVAPPPNGQQLAATLKPQPGIPAVTIPMAFAPPSVIVPQQLVTSIYSGSKSQTAQSQRAVKSDVIFMRHGFSAGNAGVVDAFKEKHDFLAGWNGELMNAGVRQPFERIKLIHEKNPEIIQRIFDADFVLISPLRRTLGTALCAYLAIWNLLGPPTKLPTVIVKNELREKWKTPSERATRPRLFFGIPYGIDERPGRKYVEQMHQSFSQEFRDLDPGGITKNPMWIEFVRRVGSAAFMGESQGEFTFPPEDGIEFITNIISFRAWLKETPGFAGKSLFIVGHSGWARYAFAHLLPDEDPNDRCSPKDAIVWGHRDIQGLNNAGVLALQFDPKDGDGFFMLDPRYTLNHMALWGNSEFENFEVGETAGIFDDVNAMMILGLVPRGSDLFRTILYNDKGKLVLVTISSIPINAQKNEVVAQKTNQELHVSWSKDIWGPPKLEVQSVVRFQAPDTKKKAVLEFDDRNLGIAFISADKVKDGLTKVGFTAQLQEEYDELKTKLSEWIKGNENLIITRRRA